MSDLMASAFANFLDHRRTKHQQHHTPSPPFISSPSTYHVLHPPLSLPPFPKRQRTSISFTDLLHQNPLPTLNKTPPSQEHHSINMHPPKQTIKTSYLSNQRRLPNSSLASPITNATTHQRPPVYPPGPLIGGIPILNSCFPSSKLHLDNLLSQKTPTTSKPTVLTTSSFSVQTLALLNEPVQKRKSNVPRPFACNQEGCSASFVKQNHLSRHIRIVHNKERPYHCTVPGCGSRFGSKSHLGDHTRAVHMRIKLFKCEMCNASWSKRFNLKKHIRVRHLGEKPFRCQQCQLSFGTRSHATRHELKVHKRSFADTLPDPNVCA